ncbi:DNA-binding response OmpR family regulator [Clostridium tetanomorphum]|uniref:Stage 0 sporulation protein A homolog n=1 Tax=Clostridium tetanomorphum TaxID=1553 RepID=A0A923EE96_CLOTT|nr:response regulator transcription factor [Clostridium tetanomorphum]KAJ50070.1 two-component response regulator YvcP [Clostridium tetanomorphum DSM 665]MBC2399258.1 response regulator transcription factor [Clostridium tetanomorphum]MBP1862813.1 DNA-binding response OmpR family regulator [Clostridium tetanomorphum]NRS86951.1 DNA-binding response OmpR family regulator [Clostridium tetanomorphum]NRZ99265.1 DNA-binding response OmpR family regulator [Clostridium tetanomorphum]
MKYKIYIVEDDLSISNILKEYITKYGFQVRTSENFEDIMEEFDKYSPDLVLLDVNLPKFDGFYWCRRIRQQSKVPIIFISARDSGMDQVMALESGADDYITKPFYYEVVIAKIKSQLRRAFGDYAPKAEERIVQVDSLKFYPERSEVEFKDKKLIITKREGILLECLMKKYPRIVNRDFLLEKIWDDLEFVEENTLSVNISRIRKRLQTLGIDNGIETIRGAGYRLNKIW